MSTRRIEGEHRVTEQYREPLPYGSPRGLGVGQAVGPALIAFLVLFMTAILGGWMFIHWLETDAWHTHPIAVCIFYAVCASPFAWWAYVAIDRHSEWKKDQEAQRSVIYNQAEALQLNAGRGFNTEVEGALTTIRVINPISLQQASKETNNYYGDSDDGEDEDIPQIESPGPRDEYLNISVDYQPHADEFLSGRKLIAGISGSGKSNSVADVCEELGRLGVPMVLADTENEYQALGSKLYLPNHMLAGRSQVVPDNAEQFGHYILDNHKQVILDLTDYDDMEEAAWVMVNIIKGMRAWQEKFANELRIPSEFLLEEAPTWLPQNVGESPLKGTEVWQPLQDAFFNNLVRKGRKRGLGVTVICQRVAEIDKRALQSDVKILHRQTEINDLKKYKEMGVSNDEAVSLQNGEAYYFSSNVSKMLIQMRLRNSPHGANTPGLKALQAHSIRGHLGTDGTLGIEPIETGLWESPRTATTSVLDGGEIISADFDTGLSVKPLNGLPGLLGTGPELSPSDLMMTDLQIIQFEVLYKALGNIKDSLRMIEGCNNRHHKHASWVVRQKNLREN